MNHNKEQGFTLIELMIVVAIIGIISAIALPMFQKYVARTQLTRVVYELASTKASIEAILSKGGFPTVDPAQNGAPYGKGGIYEYIGIEGKKPSSNIVNLATINSNAGLFQGIQATLGGDVSTSLSGSVVKLLRNTDGIWSCEILLSAKAQSDLTINGCQMQRATTPGQP